MLMPPPDLMVNLAATMRAMGTSTLKELVLLEARQIDLVLYFLTVTTLKCEQCYAMAYHIPSAGLNANIGKVSFLACCQRSNLLPKSHRLLRHDLITDALMRRLSARISRM